MAIKLFIDDIRQPPDHTWMHATTVSSAISAIARFGTQMELISLDHDISHQITTSTRSAPFPCEETFMPVAWFIGHFYRNLPKMPQVVMHTSNLTGGEEMQKVIQDLIPEADVKRKPMMPSNRFESEV